MTTLWSGRFAESPNERMAAFHRSCDFDNVLIREDIAGSKAWASALHQCGILTKHENDALQNGLDSIGNDYDSGLIALLPTDEDIHMAVERLLTERIGKAGEKLHTGRSRNDQVATDLRLYTMKQCDSLTMLVTTLQQALLDRAEADRTVIIPGYTHLQQAQPVLLAHYWLSLLTALDREKQRLFSARTRSDLMPLGSGALAGSGFSIDREALARALGFSRITTNSMDGVGARDFVLETLSAVSSLGILLSRYAEDLIIWSSREFSFIELSDAWSTGSSMMPQKKNPDSLELIRGKAGRFIGNYTRFAATLKGVGLTYYKDLQEDKETLFDSLGQIHAVIDAFTGVVSSLTVNTSRIRESLDPLLLATDLADYLVEKDVPFRSAHHIVGKIVSMCIKNKTSLLTLTSADLKPFSDAFDDDVETVLNWDAAVAHRACAGGTGGASVDRQIAEARKMLGG